MSDKSLLLIEDEPAVANFIRAALERHGYLVACAQSGAEGLQMIENNDYTGIISDMRTPGGVTGADVLAWLQKHRPQLASRLLFITGDTANEETGAILKKTGVPYIEKPFRVQQLLEAVNSAIGRAR